MEGLSGWGGAATGPERESRMGTWQSPSSDGSPVEGSSKLSSVIWSASPKGSSSEMSESKSISGTGKRFGERDETQRMRGEGGHMETSYSRKQTHD